MIRWLRRLRGKIFYRLNCRIDIESYVTDRSNTDLSFGICLECLEEQYPGYASRFQMKSYLNRNNKT